jgi:formate dehydrogenase iron-sulfur subunit
MQGDKGDIMQLNRRNFLKASAGVAGAAGLALLKSPDVAHAEGMVDRIASDRDVAMLVDTSKCVSCWWCYAACKNYNGLPETIKPEPEQPPALSSNVWTTLNTVKIADRWSSRKNACNHCSDAACVRVCPTGALSYNDMGFVQYDKEKCSGCGYCAEFCPFGVPQMSSSVLNDIAVMDKCTFCIDRVTNGQQTACAEACPYGAIKFGQRSQLVAEGKERAAELRRDNANARFYGDDELGLHVMYVLDNKPDVYNLPEDPEVPAAVEVRDILQWAGVGLTAAAIVGFGLNYIVAKYSQIKSRSADNKDE